MSPTADGGPDPGDDLAQELRELHASLSRPAKFIEPAAAERRRKSVKAVRPKQSRKARKLREPVRSRAARAYLKRRRMADRKRAGLILVAAVVLSGGGVAVSYAVAHHATLRPLAITPSSSAVPAFMLANPFAGSPASGFADGAAGIIVPASRPVGGYTTAEVARAFEMTRRLVTAANLDPGTLNGGPPAAFARLLVHQERQYFLSQIARTGVSRAGYALSTRTWVTSFAPGTTQIVGTVIKVHGYMSATTARESAREVLRIHVDYIFVYPVQRPGRPLTRMRVVQQAVANVDFAQWDDPGGQLEPWWLNGDGGPAGARCDSPDGFIHPFFPGSAADRVGPSGTPVDPYILNPASKVACQAVTRT